MHPRRMPETFPKTWSSALNVGRTPSSARVPLDPLSRMNQELRILPCQADEGVGRGPGGPPHSKMSVALGIHAARVPRPASAV